jgi:predicted HAD superfamily Cof-like phosphohydrolase
MNPYQKDVAEFHRVMEVPAPTKLTTEGYRYELRCALITEEAKEFILACGLQPTLQGHGTRISEPNWPEMIDALCDILYVTFGAAVEAGIDLDPFFALVHASNMAKLGPDGKPLRRADGKIIKPEGWKPPNINDLLEVEKLADEMTSDRISTMFKVFSDTYDANTKPSKERVEAIGYTWLEWRAAHRKLLRG